MHVYSIIKSISGAHDAVPHDISVFEVNKLCQKRGYTLQDVKQFTFFAVSGNAASGGTLASSFLTDDILAKRKKDGYKQVSCPNYDPLQQALSAGPAFEPSGVKDFKTKFKPEKSRAFAEIDGLKAASWHMSPVFKNCVARSNAMLQYAPLLTYSEMMAANKNQTFMEKFWDMLVGFTLALSFMFKFLRPWLAPAQGNGPSEDFMKQNSYDLVTYATAVDGDAKVTKQIRAQIHFTRDPMYLDTARMVVEGALTLLEEQSESDYRGKRDNTNTGVITPAVGMGSSLLTRLKRKERTTFEIEEIEKS